MLTKQQNWAPYLLLVYVFIWLILAIDPVNRINWMLENFLIMLFIACILFLYKRIPFSNLSYTYMTIFLVLHTIGAHYSYHTPVDTWLHLKRAYYDRVVHFSFGFCFLLPICELLRFLYPLPRKTAIVIANFILLAASALYEIFEVWVVCLVAPKEGALFLGMQGDPWDSQHDMEIALIGSILASIIFLIYTKIRFDPKKVESELF